MSAQVAPSQTAVIGSLFHPDPKISFSFEDYLTGELGIKLERPPKVEVCQNYLKGVCRMGNSCPFDHPIKTKLVVCKHWLRGLCKKGDSCEFLHEYNLKKMPECWFFVKLGECTNPECLYLHIDPASKKKECAWYARGFCKHGPKCRNKHIRKAACLNFLTGFCPKGLNCSLGHPKFELPLANAVEDIQDVLQQKAQYEMQQRQQHGPSLDAESSSNSFQQQQHQNAAYNQNRGQHVPYHQQQHGFQRPPFNMGGFQNFPRPPMNGMNPMMPNGGGAPGFMPRPPFQFGAGGVPGGQQQQFRPLSEITCFKCGEKGHYANHCPKRRRVDGPPM